MKMVQPLRLIGVLIILWGLWLFGAADLLAAEVTYCDSYPASAAPDCRSTQVTPTNWAGQLTIAQFDPTLGTLNAVQVTVDGYVEGQVQYENTGPNAAVISATHAVTIEVTLPNNDALRSTPSSRRVDFVPPFDNVLDFAGASGRTFAISNTKIISLTLTNPADLAPFIGAGNVSIPAVASGISFINGPGNLSALLQAQAASVVVAVTYFYASPGIDIEKFTNGRDADGSNDPDVPQIAPGNTVVWTYLVHNTGDTAFAENEVVVSDDQNGVTPVLDPSSDVGGDGLLSPDETWTYSATLPAQNLSSANAGTTIVPGCDPTGTGATRNTYQNIGSVVVGTLSDSDPSHYCNPVPDIAIKKFTNGADADGANDPDVPQIAAGDTVTWTYLVTNTGSISYPVASVVVADSQPGVVITLIDNSDGDGFLAPGEVWLYRANNLTAQNLMSVSVGTVVVPGCAPNSTDLTRATYENIGTVTVGNVTDFDPSHYCNPPAPGIAIQKLVNGNDANDPNGDDVPQLSPGDAVNWLYRVTNTGNISFTESSVVVTDTQAGVTPVLDPSSDVGNDHILGAGEVWTYRASATVQDLEAPSAGTVVVQGCNPTGLTVPGARATYMNIGQVTVPGAQADDPAHYCNPPTPAVIIKKFTNGADADDPNGADVPIIDIGAAITWTYLVTNTGNIAVNRGDITVSDDTAGVSPQFDPTSDNGDDILDPGESWRYIATGVALDLTQATNVTIVNGCTTNNTAARATYANIGTVQLGDLVDTDPSHYCNPPPTALPGDDEPAQTNVAPIFLPFVRVGK